jgi:hypothetical protein
MTSKRFYFISLGIIGLLFVGLLAGTYEANKVLTSKASKLTALKAKSAALSQEQLTLTQSKQDIKKYADLQQIAKSIVPEDKNQAEAVREIVNIASDNDVSLSSITFPASTLGTSATGAPTTTPTTPNPNSKASTLSQLQAVKGIPGVYELPITVTGDPNEPVQYSKFISFLSALEHNRRTAQVSNITIEPDAKNSNYLSFTLSLSEYIKP